MAKGKQGFTVFHADINALSSVLSAEQIGRLFIALSVYSETGEASIDDDLKGVFALLAPKIDAQNARYEETCERNRTNRSKNDHSSPVDNQNDHSSPVVTTGQPKRPLVTSRDQQEQEQEQELKQEQEHCDIGGEAANAHAHTREALTEENGKASDSVRSQKKSASKQTSQEIDKMLRDFSADDDDVYRLLKAWLENRRAKRSPQTVHAIKLNLDKLDALASESGLTRKDYLDDIVRRGWTSFFAIPHFGSQSQRAAPVQQRESTADYYMRMAQSMPDDDGGVSSDGKTSNGDFDPFDF